MNNPAKLSAPIHCIWCRYDISSLQPTDICPECAQSIQTSLDTHAVIPAQWRKTISTSLLIIIICIIPMLLSSLFAIWMYATGTSNPTNPTLAYVNWTIVILAQFVSLGAYWHYTTPRQLSDKTTLESTWGKSIRRTVATQSILLVAITIAAALLFLMGSRAYLITGAVLVVLGITYTLLLLRRTYSVMRYSEEIALHMLGFKTAVACRRIVWPLLLCLIATPFTGFFYLLSGWLYIRVLWRVRRLARNEVRSTDEEATVKA